MISPIQKKIFLAYLIILALGSGYIYYLLKNNTVDIKDLPKKEVVKDSKEVDTTLQVVENGKVIQTINLKMTNQDNVNDLLNKAILQQKSFTFEKTLLISGTRFDEVNGKVGSWKLLDSKNNEIHSPEDTNLVPNLTYRLVL